MGFSISIQTLVAPVLNWMRGMFPLCLIVLFCGQANINANAQDIERIVSPQAEQTALTIYPKNLALITETRTLDLPLGKSTIVFEGVNDRMIPTSALLRQFSGLTIERNFDAELLGKANLFERSIGETVTLTRTDKSSGIVRQVRAKIISATDGVVFDIGGKLEAYQCSGLSEATLFDNIPEGLNNKPELSIDVLTTTAGSRELEISYLADGFSWAADYRLDITSDKTAKFNAWLTFKNDTAQTFKNTQMAVIAGSLNRNWQTKSPEKQHKNLVANCWPRRSSKTPIPVTIKNDIPVPMLSKQYTRYDSLGFSDEVMVTSAREMRSSSKAPAPPEQEDLSEYKLYRMAEPLNVGSYQTKQIRFLHKAEVDVRKIYTFEESWRSLLNPNQVLRQAILETRLDNTKDGKLAKPLPSGTYRVMKRTAQGQAVIDGIDELKNRTVDLPVKIKTKTSPNVQMRTRITFLNKGDDPSLMRPRDIKVIDIVEHTFYNAHAKPISIEFKATGAPNFRYKNKTVNGITRYGQVLHGYNGAPYKVKKPSIKPDADQVTPTWTLTIAPNNSRVLRYTAKRF